MLNADGIDATNKMFKTDLAKEPTIFMEFRGQTVDACKLDSDKCAPPLATPCATALHLLPVVNASSLR